MISKNKTILVRAFFFTILLIILGNIFFVVSKSINPDFFNEYFNNKNQNNGRPITVLTPQVIEDSSFSGPFLMVVKKNDNSFSYADVLSGQLNNNIYSNEVKISNPNNDINYIDPSQSQKVPFTTKIGQSEQVQIYQPLIGYLKLPDETTLLVKFIDATVIDGKITGNFRALLMGQKEEISGSVVYGSQIQAASISPTLITVDAFSYSINTEIMKLAYDLENIAPANVLGASKYNVR